MRKSNVLIAIFIVIVLLVLTVVLLACTVFVVRHVRVESEVSSSWIKEDEIVSSGGISIGKSIITLNKDKVATSIEESNPHIKVISVERRFPNTVIIKVTDRFDIMHVRSADGAYAAVLDAELKILAVIPAEQEDDLSTTFVSGVTFGVPEDGAAASVGTFLEKEGDAKLTVLSEIAQAAEKYLDLARASFRTFFKKIEFAAYDGGMYTYITTNTGVIFVLDTGISTPVYEQLSRCKYVYDSTEVELRKNYGYIALDKDSDKVAYKWLESID